MESLRMRWVSERPYKQLRFWLILMKKKVPGPFLVVGPLSTLHNWIREFKLFCPSLPVILYHGTKEEREKMRHGVIPLAKERDAKFPVVVTSYEVTMKDQPFLRHYHWKYIIVDEGHRLKNLNCKLVQQLKSYASANRLLLTGTPLQNNLSELWSLLNFLLPNIFDDLESFQSWFQFDSLQNKEGEAGIIAQERSDQVVTKLHHIIRPFVLRRVKKDVDLTIPPKKEITLYAPLSKLQLQYYDAVRNNDLKSVLTEDQVAVALRQGQKLGMLNVLMQLRKVCNHPFLFYEDPDDDQNDGKKLVSVCGKLALLDKLLPRLRKHGNRVLIFSQMTRMMDILEDYLTFRKMSYARLDGSTPIDERQREIERFQQDKDVFVFLLSTRAGGLGINVTAADTVILYDSDFNPQMDLQAVDRCHRIGQTRPVVIYRLVTAGTVEEMMVTRATQKRKLEKLVISGGYLKDADKRHTHALKLEDLTELLNVNTASEYVGDQLISDDSFDHLTDPRFRLEVKSGEGFSVVDPTAAGLAANKAFV
eukprot:Rmarinus@m.23235